MAPGESVYGEKRISVPNEDGTKVEYRVRNPFRSKLAAAIIGGVDNIWINLMIVRGTWFSTDGIEPVYQIRTSCMALLRKTSGIGQASMHLMSRYLCCKP